jgi:hypothetical protein
MGVRLILSVIIVCMLVGFVWVAVAGRSDGGVAEAMAAGGVRAAPPGPAPPPTPAPAPGGCRAVDRLVHVPRGVRPPLDCAPGQERVGLLCFPPCRVGWRPHPHFPHRCFRCRDGMNSCDPDTPDAETEDRDPLGPAEKCPPGTQRIGGLCFDPCPPGYRAEADRCFRCRA